MSIYYLAALSVGMIWASTSIISLKPARYFGAVRFNMWRMTLVSGGLIILATLTNGWQTISDTIVAPLVLSGFFGIFLGDTLMFAALGRIGPRRTPVLFASNAPFVTILGWIFLGEILPPITLVGIGLVFVGVVLAILYGNRQNSQHDMDDIRGKAWIGVALALAAALCQATGILLSRPIMENGSDPVAASALRVGMAALALVSMNALRKWRRQPAGGDNSGLTYRQALLRTAISGTLGMGIGMTLLLFALGGGESGIVATLSATAPFWVLPLIWAKTGERPASGAFLGAGLVIVGCGFIFGFFDMLLSDMVAAL